MDKTKFPDLDPALKEAYERIMGHNYPNHALKAQPQHHKRQEKVYVREGHVAEEGKPRSNIKIILLIIGLAILFYIYALIWSAIFSYKLPFSPL